MPPSANGPVLRLSVSADGTSSKTRFALRATREVFIRTDLAALNGQHLVALRIFSPSGTRYDELRAAVSGQAGPPGRVQRDEGPPQGLALHRLTGRTPARIDLILPVAGTFITQHSLFGQWSIAAHLDGEEVPRAVTSFVLE